MYCWIPAQCSLCFYLFLERLAFMLDLVWHGGQVLRGSLPSSKLPLGLELAILTIPLADNLFLLWLLCVGWNDRHAMVPYIELSADRP